MSLIRYLHEQDWPALETAWQELMLEEERPLDEVFDTLAMARERKRMVHCVPLVKDHADLLCESNRARDAAELLGTCMLGGGSPGELAGPLWRCAEATWGAEPWWPAYSELAGLRENAPDMRGAWSAFRSLLAMDSGTAVYHGKGWGIGLVTDLDRDQLEVQVVFVSGRRDRFPLQTAVEIFEVLPAEDLRSLLVRDPDELKRLVREEPLEVLRALLRRYQGKATQALLKTAMAQCGIDGPAFTGWWKRTRKAADTSPWFELSGSGAKAQVRMLIEASDPVDNLRRQLRLLPNLRSALQRVRELLGGGELAPEMRSAALETLAELADSEDGELPRRFQAWMFLRELTGSTPEPLAERLLEAASIPAPEIPSDPPTLWALFQSFPGAREQERCTELLREVAGDDRWLDEAARHLPHAAPGMVRGLVEALLAAGRGQELASHYNFLLPRPSLNPHLFIRLAELVEEGRIEGKFPGPVQRAQVLIQLSSVLRGDRAGPSTDLRARSRLCELLTRGKPPLLRRLMEDADRDALRATLSLVERGVDDVIESVFTDVVVELAPEIFRAADIPFWDHPCIWTTRSGLVRRQRELRELLDVKIPENSEAIGKAASLGDLSENSEWESALEEQRNLTARAAQIQAEVKNAELLEEAPVPEDTICPGTEVRYRDPGTGVEQRIRLLGPWDTDEEGVVSYRSPLAKGLLGLHTGDRARIQVPSGEVEVEVLEIQTLPLPKA